MGVVPTLALCTYTCCQDRFSRSEADADGGAKAISERMGSGNYYLQVVKVEAKQVAFGGQRGDGDRASDNRSAGKTWPLDAVLRPLHESGRGVSEASGEARNGSILFNIRTKELQRSIYSLYTRGRMRGDDQEGGRAVYSTKAKLWMSKYLLSRDQGQVGPGIRSLNVKGKARGT